MSFVVAITRLSPSAAAAGGRGPEAAALASLFGVGAYELGVALGGGVPLVLAHTDDAEQARALLAALRGRAHGAVACDASKVIASEGMISPREFALEAHIFLGDAPPTGRVELPWSDVLALIAATHLVQETTTTETAQKQFSAGRALLTGGLVRNKTVAKTEMRSAEEREPVLYVVRRTVGGHWLLAESRLRYTGLGSRRGPAAHENFNTLIALLREHAPDALYNDRLLARKRSAASLQVSGAAKSRTLTSSNASETDLAVHLITIAHMQGQL